MSGGYASRLSHYPDKGVCGLPECIDSSRQLKNKLVKLKNLVKAASFITILTGAGISTSAGIPDFRGPNGIWTIEDRMKKEKTKKRRKEGDVETRIPKKKRCLDKVSASFCVEEKVEAVGGNKNENGSGSFELAVPTLTHHAITKLTSLGIVNFVVTQNVDGLHRRSGLPRSKQSVLHGCVFTEKCEKCQEEYFRDYDVQGVSFQKTGRKCLKKNCEGDLRDTVLDWEDELPSQDYEDAQMKCSLSDLVICLGTSLRIEPAGSLPLRAEKFVIVNMQKTPYDGKADLVVRARVDDVMNDLMTRLGVQDWNNFSGKEN